MKDRQGDHNQSLPETMTDLLASPFRFKEPSEQQVIASKSNVRKLLYILIYGNLYH